VATNFLQAAGSHGFIVTPFNLMSTELGNGTGLANANSATSSAGGTAGVFTQTNFANAIWGDVYFSAGGAFTPAVGGYISGWFLFSEAGSTFEINSSNVDLARAPDFTIPFGNFALASGNLVKANGIVRLPAYDCKVYVVNHTGVALAASGNLIKVAPEAIQY
jgi:hypothetical protein